MLSAHVTPLWDDIVWRWCCALTPQSELGSATSFSIPERLCMTAVIFFSKYQVEFINEPIGTWDLCETFKWVVVFVCYMPIQIFYFFLNVN